MAKSMRSKIKRRFRAIKRQSVFAPVETARTQRLATKQAAGLQRQNSQSEQESTINLSSDMIVDTDSPKISTSGPRNSRHQQWKRKKLTGKKKRNDLIHF